jgi:radical SAM superfamily enzyme YgiQ (UPF0313 family)
MMRVLLVRHHNAGNINTRLPETINKAQGIYPPLGIAYIASILENSGHKVKILDSQAMNLKIEEIRKEITKFNPDVVGVTCMTPNLRDALDVSRVTKEISEDIITVLGGPHLYIYPKETLTYSYVDFGVAGEGEIVLPELILSLQDKKKFKDIDGLIFKENGKIKYNPVKGCIRDLDSLPFPARHLLPNKKYFSILADYPFTTMITSRGCSFHCGFCFKNQLDNIIRFRSPENVADEIEQCLEMGFKDIWFYDDTFTINKKHVVGICNEILERGLEFKWEAVTRVDCVNPELLRTMRRVGCYRIRYGVESGDQYILNLMKKGIKLQQARKAIKWTKLAGIEAFCLFMIGYPGENEDKIRKTIDFSLDVNPDWAMFSNTVPYPSTDLLKLSHKIGLLNDKEYWKEFTLGKTNERIPYGFPNLDTWMKIAYKRFYFRPKFILKTVSKIRNIRQIKKYMTGLWALINFRGISV